MARNDRVRPPNIDVELTREQQYEYTRCKLDFVYFCRNYVKVQHPTRGSVPFDLYPYQIRMVKNFIENRFNIVLSARQTGKCVDPSTKIVQLTPKLITPKESRWDKFRLKCKLAVLRFVDSDTYQYLAQNQLD